MKDGVPRIYWTFRAAWTLLHFLIVAAASAVLLIWALDNNNAQRIFESSAIRVLDVQERVSQLIPWPWATGKNDVESSSRSAPRSTTKSEIGKKYQVVGNVRVRVAPRINSKRVTTLGDGDWITIDCTARGSAVDPGPYQSKLSEWSGVNNSSTTLWDHIPGLGYVSDAYVATYSRGPVAPQCKE